MSAQRKKEPMKILAFPKDFSPMTPVLPIFPLRWPQGALKRGSPALHLSASRALAQDGNLGKMIFQDRELDKWFDGLPP